MSHDKNGAPLLPQICLKRFELGSTHFAPFKADVSVAISAFAVQSDGKIIVSELYGGSYLVPITVIVKRLFPDGSIDSSFGAAPAFIPTSILIEPDGSVVLASASQVQRIPGEPPARFGMGIPSLINNRVEVPIVGGWGHYIKAETSSDLTNWNFNQRVLFSDNTLTLTNDLTASSQFYRVKVDD